MCEAWRGGGWGAKVTFVLNRLGWYMLYLRLCLLHNVCERDQWPRKKEDKKLQPKGINFFFWSRASRNIICLTPTMIMIIKKRILSNEKFVMLLLRRSSNNVKLYFQKKEFNELSAYDAIDREVSAKLVGRVKNGWKRGGTKRETELSIDSPFKRRSQICVNLLHFVRFRWKRFRLGKTKKNVVVAVVSYRTNAQYTCVCRNGGEERGGPTQCVCVSSMWWGKSQSQTSAGTNVCLAHYVQRQPPFPSVLPGTGETLEQKLLRPYLIRLKTRGRTHNVLFGRRNKPKEENCLSISWNQDGGEERRLKRNDAHIFAPIPPPPSFRGRWSFPIYS